VVQLLEMVGGEVQEVVPLGPVGLTRLGEERGVPGDVGQGADGVGEPRGRSLVAFAQMWHECGTPALRGETDIVPLALK
jgi:hypothetical protein